MRRIRVGISLGDPSGIGPWVTARALKRPELRHIEPVLFGDEADRRRFPKTAEFHAVSKLASSERRAGQPSRAGGRAQFEAIVALIDAAKRHHIDAMCTAPVSKEQITRAGIPFTGHTEALAQAFDSEVVMLMRGPKLSVALATNHLPLAAVPAELSVEGLVSTLKIVDKSLSHALRRRPAIAVCALNPHAGEGGTIGREEIDVILPAIRAARRSGLELTGPHGADGLFAHRKGFDVALAMFHDQGLVAVKALDFARTVNVTLGLPIPRTSPDHGTAYELAALGKADDRPMAAALREAARLASTQPPV